MINIIYNKLSWVKLMNNRHLPFRLSLKAYGGYSFIGSFFLPIPSLLEQWWLDSILIILLLAIYAAFIIQNIRLRKAHERHRDFSHSLIDLQEKERKRIAAELHDSIGQNLLIIKNSALIGLRLKRSPSKMAKRLTEISDYASQTLQDIRKVSQNLRPVLLDRLGLTESLLNLVGTISSATSIQTTASIDRVDNLLNKEAEINVFRIVQESLNNIVKHSQATHAEISIKKNAQKIRILINDNGKGMDTSSSLINTNTGMGLFGIAERINMLNGTWQISSLPDSGTSIQVEIPYNHT
jgi:signal transduction histidine kinase